MLKADFHSHTNFLQKETDYSPNELIDLAVKRGYDVLCITEHYFHVKDTLPDYKKDPLSTYHAFKDYAAKKGLLLLPGAEVKYPEGEVLLVNFKGNIREYPTLQSLQKLPKSVLVIAPHPYFKKSICLGKHLEQNINLFDAIEHSYYYVKWLNFNKKAIEVAKRFSKPLVGNSDCHGFNHFGYTYTLVEAKKNANSIVRAVRNGKVKVVTKPLPFWLFAQITFLSMLKYICCQILLMFYKAKKALKSKQ